MKLSHLSAGLLASAFVSFGARAQVTLPATAALPTGSGANPGFVVRTVQAPPEAIIDNTYLRAIRQLNGTLTDAEGNTIEDISETGPQPGGVTFTDNVDLAEEEFNGSGLFFEDRLFPGLALGGSKDLFATEVVAFVELPAGQIRMGVTAGFARTDEVNDDGWRLFSGTNPRSFFNSVVAEFARNAPHFPTELNSMPETPMNSPSPCPRPASTRSDSSTGSRQLEPCSNGTSSRTREEPPRNVSS